MLVLAIDTATAATSVAVVRLVDGEAAAEPVRRRHVDPRGHGEHLAPLVRAALAEAGGRPADLTAIVAGTGPGPYTGLRVGLATAAAMGQALSLPTYDVCSLDGLGAILPGNGLVATDARRREIYWAIYTDRTRVAGPGVARPEDLLPTIAAHGVGQGYGEGALRYRAALGVPVAAEPVYPDPVALVEVAAARIVAGAEGESLTPRYLRRPDAAEPGTPKPVTPG
ncbi:tRNA (adenosine(37)-N6)-threonylcarbamoyltransferase complex dimerization subunit type 1 TsaB [Natronosporangium hydrolyticum]|uniref:tRNA (Adenosine(37)-N6)-threonylcarbamoyltransferase complex dimerization subunit type 1 TsaB n=1 Tax=Natronosporangium hydrolyticum TaxID=2811111 RepID=A0A895YDE8_9ACTN|nr:tRNA (adenosine(37)-N6)-threonylcarbamoyltransferase complex dimerization subunit type 1 TsaB [Natronosporangium hydrolyticum]QSB15571.1 tRNA (adenosine(37)-N6)-threonylcarbamoyltransferase complex dimerization subunit type 1 TsaB [Natronosporangium hydrolyticum]